MKRKIFSVLFAVVLACTLGLVTAVPVAAAVLTVDTSLPDTPPNYHTIQAAITAAETDDTINVAAGTYAENVNVNKQLTLTGDTATPSNVVVDASGTGNAITLSANGITLDGFRATGSEVGNATGYAGISVESSNNIIINNDASDNGHHGIVLLDSSSGNAITGNTANNNGSVGIHLYDNNTGNTIMGNTANDNTHDGINLDHASNGNTITGNTANGNGTVGIGIVDSDGNTITGNTANGNNNGISLTRGELDTGCTGTTIENNTTNQNWVDGIRLAKSNVNTITGNTANSNGRDGIRIDVGSDSNTITGNTASGNDGSYGTAQSNAAGITIQAPESANNAITGNTLTKNQEGILIKGTAGTGNTAHFNNIYDNIRYGIEAGVAVDATSNWWGDASGPMHASNPLSTTGDAVSDYVDYCPWLDNVYATGNPTAPVLNATQGTVHCTIQDAIDSATAGDTITVLPGIYRPSDPTPDSDSTGELTINKEGLTLKSTGDATETIIEAKVGNTGSILIAASDVTLDGFTIKGTSETALATGCIYMNVDGTTGVTIENNIIEWTGNGSTKAGIVNKTGSSVEATITNNTISGFWINVALNPGFEATIGPNNTIKDSENDGIWVGSNAGVTITGNTITSNAEGVVIEGDDVTISENDISSNGKGIKVKDGVGSTGTITVNYNAITGNTEYGLLNDEALLTVDAEYNWWGDVAGPDTSLKTTGLHNPYEYWTHGDNVSNYVDYLPWLIRIDLVTDYDGWNIVSWPIMGEEGDSEPPPETIGFYWFDSFTQKWDYDPYEAGPLDALYVKLAEDAEPMSFYYPVSSGVSFPSQKVMKKGWNFVGLAELCQMPVCPALASAYWGTGEAGPWGYSQVISPSLNGASWTYMRKAVPPAVPQMFMLPTKGYWVFMVNDGVLGGFSSTPIVEVDVPIPLP